MEIFSWADNVRNEVLLSQEGKSTRLPFVNLLSRRAQSDRSSSFGKRVWFTESHIVLIISFLLVLFTQFIVDKMKKVCCIKLSN